MDPPTRTSILILQELLSKVEVRATELLRQSTDTHAPKWIVTAVELHFIRSFKTIFDQIQGHQDRGTTNEEDALFYVGNLRWQLQAIISSIDESSVALQQNINNRPSPSQQVSSLSARGPIPHSRDQGHGRKGRAGTNSDGISKPEVIFVADDDDNGDDGTLNNIEILDPKERGPAIFNFVKVTDGLLKLVPAYNGSAVTPPTMFNAVIQVPSPRSSINEIRDIVDETLKPPRTNMVEIERLSPGIYGMRTNLAGEVDDLMAVSGRWSSAVGDAHILFPRYQVHLECQWPLPGQQPLRAIKSAFYAENRWLNTSTMLAPEGSVDTAGKCVIAFSRPGDARAVVARGVTWESRRCSCVLLPLRFYSGLGIQMEVAALGGSGSSSGPGNFRSDREQGDGGNSFHKRAVEDGGTTAASSTKRSRLERY